MKNEITGLIGIIGGIFVFIRRETFVQMFINQQNYGKKIHRKFGYRLEHSESYYRFIVWFMIFFFVIGGTLTFFGVLQAK